MYVSFEVVIIGYYMAQTRTKIFFYEKTVDLDTVFIVENLKKYKIQQNDASQYRRLSQNTMHCDVFCSKKTAIKRLLINDNTSIVCLTD